MSDTSPPILSTWSGPAVPQCCLASKSQARMSSERLQARLEERLKDRLHGRGSMIYRTDWKQHITPLGRQIFRLRASALRTSVSELSSELSGWPTATTRDWKDTGDLSGSMIRKDGKLRNDTIPRVASMSGWPTPNAGPQNDRDSKWEIRRAKIKAEKKNGNGFGMTLGMAATLSGWGTPMSSSPTSTHCYSGKNPDGTNKIALKLPEEANLVESIRRIASGEILIGYTSETESGVLLNPRLPRWLMGFPQEWCDCAVTAMQSVRKPLRRSLKRSATLFKRDAWLTAA